ncbi:hypothetical protein MKX50_15280 [Paenibacillus sp. FSL W8-0186]|uniref:hypothetical protein n=1 Tax=Paenibacillus sp. FSL W8-0186 TaxID=2921709 RepID=UPI0030D23FB0
MPRLQTQLQYNDPSIVIWRDPPYIDRADSLPVINGIITLLEIPSSQDRVRIVGMVEVHIEDFIHKNTLEPDEFHVNYGNGQIQFHPSHEGKTLLCEYKGKGQILLPASRVYAMVERSPDIVKTLQDIIDEMLHHLSQYNSKLVEINHAIAAATQAAVGANLSADNANKAAQTALNAADQALVVIRDAMKIYKAPVNNYGDLATTYPRPELGWTVMVRNTGNIYRWDGFSWILIENFTQMAFPIASRTVNGLMSKEDFIAFHDKLELKTLMFLVGKPKLTGVPPLISSFPFAGEIKNVKAFCLHSGSFQPTEIEIQKISEANFKNNGIWDNILTDNISFPVGSLESNTHTVSNHRVNANDYFRLNITDLDSEIHGITIQIDIQI